MTRAPLWRCAALLSLAVFRVRAQVGVPLVKASDLIPVLTGQQATAKTGGVTGILNPLEFSPDSPLEIANGGPVVPPTEPNTNKPTQPVTPPPFPTWTASASPPGPASTTSTPPVPTATPNLRGSGASSTPSPATSPSVDATSTPALGTLNAATATPTPTQPPASSAPCQGLESVSVENVPGVFCVHGANICTGENRTGQCPGVSVGLPEGSHCGVVATGVYGCRRGPAPGQ